MDRPMNARVVLLVILVAGSLVGARQSTVPAPSGPVEWHYYGGDPGGIEVLAADRYQAGERSAAAVAWQWKHWDAVPAARRVFREHAADDRRRVVCDDAVQQHGGRRCRNRQRDCGGSTARPRSSVSFVRQRMEAARDRILARRWSGCVSS